MMFSCLFFLVVFCLFFNMTEKIFVGLLRLQQIYQGLRPGNASFQVESVKRIANVSTAIEFLRTLESLNRWSRKFIVLDCPSSMAKEIIISHVRDITLGRRTYHYLLSDLVSRSMKTCGYTKSKIQQKKHTKKRIENIVALNCQHKKMPSLQFDTFVCFSFVCSASFCTIQGDGRSLGVRHQRIWCHQHNRISHR